MPMPNAYATRNGTSFGSSQASSSASSAASSKGTSVARGSQSAHVTHAARNGVHVLRYSGRVNYMSAPAIQRFLDELLDEGAIGGLIFDLSDAEGLDSTNLGLLARVNERVRELRNVESMIVSSNRDITDVLLSMGFDQSFALVTEPAPSAATGRVSPVPPASGGRDIEAPQPTQAELHATMLEAHRALVRLSDAGRLQFQDVVACLESDRPSH